MPTIFQVISSESFIQVIKSFESFGLERLTDEKAEQFKTNFAQVIADERKRDQHVKALEEVKNRVSNKFCFSVV